ncbi:MAG: hypothetical protein WD557_18710 [Dehalococcoidia bacterium]
MRDSRGDVRERADAAGMKEQLTLWMMAIDPAAAGLPSRAHVAYNYSFNPGGGFAYQGDSVVRHYNQLLAEQGLPALG